jgi:DNA-binding CsgD family transcriptional regulator
MKQQDVAQVLSDPLAQELMQSNIPARLAYVGPDGFPRAIPIGFHWNGAEFVLCTVPHAALQSAPSCDGVADITSLTKRETAVAELAAQGLSNKQIAHRLDLSEHTVKNHLFHIFDKLDVSKSYRIIIRDGIRTQLSFR